MDILDSKFPTLQLIEEFCRFAELVKAAPDELSPYLPDIRILHAQAIEHLLKQRTTFPAFASFSQIQEVRLRLAQRSMDLRVEIDRLIPKLYNDGNTRSLMRYIKQSTS